MDEIKNRLKEAINLKGWTASDLARYSGVSKGEISRYLKGTVIPKQSKVYAMAQALGVSPSWLLGFAVARGGGAIKGKPVADLDVTKLSEINQAKLEAYYKALLDSQEANNGDA